jgi:hypothetical protein
MWSGPRNISTAVMRAWGNRTDTVIIDEPFYAYYLRATGKKHPGADEIIAEGETDWRKVVAHLTGPIPGGKKVFFQKQMTHHLLPEVDRQWLVDLTNCFLIRDPGEVILSYIKKNPDPALEDLGFVQQAEIFDFVVGTPQRGVPTHRYRCARCAGESAKDFATVLRSGRRRIRQGNARMAARFARDRRHLGEILVRRSGKIDIIPAIPTERRNCSGSSARNSRSLPRMLRAAL